MQVLAGSKHAVSLIHRGEDFCVHLQVSEIEVPAQSVQASGGAQHQAIHLRRARLIHAL